MDYFVWFDSLGKINGCYDVQNFENVWARDKSVSTYLSLQIREFIHIARQYHTWPLIVHGIAVMCVDTLSYPYQQTIGG